MQRTVFWGATGGRISTQDLRYQTSAIGQIAGATREKKDSSSCASSAHRRPRTALGIRLLTVVLSLATAGAAQAVLFSTRSVTFHSTALQANSVPVTVTLQNPSASPLTISNFTFAGSDASEFTQTNTCGSQLAAVSSCLVTIVFTPQVAGTRSASLSVADNARNITQTISLGGVGVAFSDPSAISRIMTSTCQQDPNTPCSGIVTVQATSADAFVDSQGTLFDPTVSYYSVEKANALSAGFRHIRSANTNPTYVARIKDMAAAGLKTQFVNSANANYVPDPVNFWSAAGQSISLLSFLTTNFGPNVSATIDAIEGPNELDIEWGNTFWHPSDYPHTTICPTNNCGEWLGAYGVAFQKSLYTAIKGNPQTSGMKVIGPSVGYSFPSPFSAAAGGGGSDLQGYADWGGCHPYNTAGNGNFLAPTTYDGSSYYNAYTMVPSGEVDFAPYAWWQCNSSTSDGRGTVYGTIPLAPSEQGYYTGTANGALTEDIQARYYPRIYAEMYRHGMPRTITYRFDDICADLSNPECNFGLMRFDQTVKPAFFAIKSLNDLLKEPGASFHPGSLTYTITVSPNGSFTRTQYMHDLLLQKSNGDYYLLFWHEIADVKKQNDDGSFIQGPAVPLNPLSLPITVTLPSSVMSATLYTYDINYNLIPRVLAITAGNQISLTAIDTISVIRLSQLP
jgi:hypothetical protein